MARPKSKLNEATSKVIEDNVLLENPEGLEEAAVRVAVIKEMPKMETIIFRNDRDPGVMLEFHYASATHPLQHYKLYHGHEHTLPVEVIEHLESRAIPITSYKKGPEGHPESFISGYKYQFTCKPVRKTA